MRTLVFLLILALSPAVFSQEPQQPAPVPDPTRQPVLRLPNGRLMRDEVVKDNYRKSLEDSAELVRLAQTLQTDLQKAGAFVVPVRTIKTTEDIEKLAKRIRGRMK